MMRCSKLHPVKKSSIRARACGALAHGVLLAGLVAVVVSCTKKPSQKPEPGLVKAPPGLPPVPVPAANPMTAEKVELGKLLYFDKRLSKDGTISCATCHDPKMAWAEHTPTSKGVKGQLGGANAPTVINSAYMKSMFWDGRAADLEEQALGPVENPIEMGHSLDVLVKDLQKIPEYQKRFKAVFGTDVTKEGIAKAIASFERTILSGDSPYDKYMAGDKSALDDAAKKGLKVFEDAGCKTCHAPPTFSNSEFYNAGIGMDKTPPDKGREGVTADPKDRGKYRVPALREVANTAPYFHDGSVATLEEAVKIMASGGKDNANLSVMLQGVRAAKLTEDDQKNLVAFLKALSGKYPVMEPPELPKGP